MTIEVRRATGDDALALLELSREWDDVPHAVDDVGSVERALQREDGEAVYVAVVEKTVVGFATVQRTTSFRYRRPTLELTALYVAKSHRRRGVGSRLLEAARSLTESTDALELFLRVNRDNREAVRLYESRGMILAGHRVYRDRHY